MRKLSQVAATASLVLAFAGGVASADVSNNGAGSTNTQNNTSTSNVVCINNNVISSTNNNTSTSTSGNASSTNNTPGGSATSGNASSSTNSNVTVTVNGSCPAGTTAAPADSPAAKAAAAGKGGLRFDTAGNLLLPETGANDTIKLAVIVAAIIAVFAAASQFGLGIYRKALNR